MAALTALMKHHCLCLEGVKCIFRLKSWTGVPAQRGRGFHPLVNCGKNQGANIDADEEAALKKLAETLLQMTPRSVSKALEAAELIEVECDA